MPRGKEAELPGSVLPACAGAAIQVEDRHAPVEDLQIGVVPADLFVPQEHIGPGLAADQRKRLWEDPAGGARAGGVLHNQLQRLRRAAFLHE